MKTVHSELLNVSITGNMITRHGIAGISIVDLASDYCQVSIVKTGDDEYDVTAPMDEQDHWQFAALIHRLNSENKLGQNRNPDDDGPKGPTPPTGGTPGAAKQELFEHVRAMAA